MKALANEDEDGLSSLKKHLEKIISENAVKREIEALE